MDEVEDFNQLLKSKLSERIAKKDLQIVLETCKNVLKKEIYESKNVEGIFEEETWNLLSSCIEGYDTTKEDSRRAVLELLQLYTIIIPKGNNIYIYKRFLLLLSILLTFLFRNAIESL